METFLITKVSSVYSGKSSVSALQGSVNKSGGQPCRMGYFCAKPDIMKKRMSASRIVQHFFQGVLILAPIFLTVWVIIWVFQTLDSFLKVRIPQVGIIPGLGVVIILVGITVVGFLSSNFILGRLFDLFDRLFGRTPIIRIVYSSIRDIFDALIGDKRKFDHPVLVNIYADDVWELGFITQGDASEFGLQDVVAVYVPMSLAISGKVYFVKKEKITALQHISAGAAMKFAVSGGVTGVGSAEPVPAHAPGKADQPRSGPDLARNGN